MGLTLKKTAVMSGYGCGAETGDAGVCCEGKAFEDMNCATSATITVLITRQEGSDVHN